MLWIQNCFSVSDGGFCTTVFRIPDHRVFVGYKDLLVGFHGMSDKRFSGLRISIGLSRFGFSGSLGSFGFTGFKDFSKDTGFGF
jgi:hypothetical protein